MRPDRIRDVRELRKLTLDDLAELTGISRPQLHRIEHGKSNPSAHALISIAKSLSVSADYLAGLTDAPGDLFAEDSLSDLELALVRAVRDGKVGEALASLKLLLEK
mgnify:CR=1 FL=1